VTLGRSEDGAAYPFGAYALVSPHHVNQSIEPEELISSVTGLADAVGPRSERVARDKRALERGNELAHLKLVDEVAGDNFH
jgi:hypothetical protein